MCGRYTETASLETLRERFGFRAPEFDLKPRYNIAPSQDCPVVVDDGGRSLRMFRWGLIPSWAKDPAVGHKMINARAETLLEKPSFKGPFQKSRCLVLADGFYEWRREGGVGIPMRIALKSREPFAMAGLWDAWQAPDGTTVRSFAIVTTAANEAMRTIHHRMPVIFGPRDEGAWLDPAAKTEKLAGLLGPWPGELAPYEVSRWVNSPANDKPECLEPVGG